MRLVDSVIFLARLDARVEGFIQLYPLWSSWYCKRMWFLSDLYVREPSRRLGLGKLLVERVIAYAKETHAVSVMVELPHREPRLEHFYAKLGFQKDEVFDLARHSLSCSPVAYAACRCVARIRRFMLKKTLHAYLPVDKGARTCAYRSFQSPRLR